MIDQPATITSLIDRLVELQDAVLNSPREHAVEIATRQLSKPWHILVESNKTERFSA